MIFSGSVSGAGDFIVNANKDPAKGQDFIFTGNLTAFTGDFSRPVANYTAGGEDAYNNKTTGILQFGGTVSNGGIGAGTAYVASATADTDGIVHNISGTNQSTITTTSVLRYNYTGSANEGVTALGIDNSSISARYLDFCGGANYTVSSAVSGNNAPASNNTLTISAGTTTFTGAVSNFGNVTVASGATLAVGTTGTLNLSGANVTLGSAIANSGTVTLSGTTVFVLDNLTATNGTYSLITGNSVTDVSGVSFMYAGSAIKSSRLSVSTTNGYAVTVTNYSDLVWAGTAENSVWNTTAENWSSTTAGGSVAFENRDSVTFGADAGVSKTVSVASVVVANSVAVSDSYEFAFSNNGSVTASTMSIADGKTLTLAGTGALTTGAVSGGGNLTVGAGVEATFSAANTLSGSMTLDGTLNLNNSVLSVSENTATISALSSLTGFSGSGRLVLDITGKAEAKNVDFSPVNGFTGTLVVKGSSRMNLLGETDSLNAINQFAGIEVQSGAQLYLSAWTGEGTRVSNLSRTLTIAGAGYGSNENQAALCMADNATLSGQLILSGNATVYSATGTQTISGGISAAGKTLTIKGANILNISGTADITIGTLTLSKSGNTNLSATGTTTIGRLNGAAGTVNISEAVTISERLSVSASGTVNIGKDDGNAVTVTAGSFFTNDSSTDGTNTVNIKAGATLNITGSTNNATDSRQSSILIGHWNGTSNVNVAGTLSAANAVVNVSWTAGKTATLTVKDGGKVSALGIGQAQSGSGTANFVMEDGGTLELGASGITKNMTQFQLGAGTFRLTNNWSSATTQAMTLSSAAGTTFDTNGFSATLNGALSDVSGVAGALKKTGAGTLTLGGTNTFTGGVEIAKGVVAATNAAALGAAANAVRISGGQLSVGGVTLNQTNISVVLNDGAYLTGAAIFGTGSGALADGTTISVSGDVEALKAVCTSATGRYDFTLYDNNTLTTTGVTDVTVDSDFASALEDAGWTYSLSEDKSMLTITIPEPSAFGLLAGAGALALVAARRRRTKKA